MRGSFETTKTAKVLHLEQELFIFLKIFESVAPGGEQENYEGPGEGGAAYAVPKNKANKAELSINKYGQFLFRYLWEFLTGNICPSVFFYRVLEQFLHKATQLKIKQFFKNHTANVQPNTFKWYKL
jgi:hypothetical protein